MTRIHDLLVREAPSTSSGEPLTVSSDAVRRYAARWLRERRRDAGDGAAAFIPLVFRPGEAYQFDWSHEDVEIAGKPIRVKAAHMRLCASRAVYVRVYPREWPRRRGGRSRSVPMPTGSWSVATTRSSPSIGASSGETG